MNKPVRSTSAIALAVAISLGTSAHAAEPGPLSASVLVADLVGIKAAIDAGAAVNAVDPATTHNALHTAVSPGGTRDADTVSLLASLGANLELIDPNTKLTPLMAAMVMTDSGPFAGLERTKAANLVGRLLELGANPNHALAGGETPLKLAIGMNNLAVVRLLLARGAEPNAVDAEKTTALHIAYGLDRSRELIDALLGAGADPLLRNVEGKTPAQLQPSALQAAGQVIAPATPLANVTPAGDPPGKSPASAPAATESSSIRKWLIGGAIAAAAILGAVALDHYVKDQNKKQQIITAALNSPPPTPAPPPLTPPTLKPLPPPTTPPTLKPPQPITPPPSSQSHQIVIEKLIATPAQPVAGTEFALSATLQNKTNVDIVNDWTLTGPNGLAMGPFRNITKAGLSGQLAIRTTLPNPGKQVLTLQMNPVQEPGAQIQRQQITVDVQPRPTPIPTSIPTSIFNGTYRSQTVDGYGRITKDTIEISDGRVSLVRITKTKDWAYRETLLAGGKLDADENSASPPKFSLTGHWERSGSQWKVSIDDSTIARDQNGAFNLSWKGSATWSPIGQKAVQIPIEGAAVRGFEFPEESLPVNIDGRFRYPYDAGFGGGNLPWLNEVFSGTYYLDFASSPGLEVTGKKVTATTYITDSTFTNRRVGLFQLNGVFNDYFNRSALGRGKFVVTIGTKSYEGEVGLATKGENNEIVCWSAAGGGISGCLSKRYWAPGKGWQ